MRRSAPRARFTAHLALLVWVLSALVPVGGLELCLGCERGPLGAGTLGLSALELDCACHDACLDGVVEGPDALVDGVDERLDRSAVDRSEGAAEDEAPRAEPHDCRDVAVATPLAMRERAERTPSRPALADVALPSPGPAAVLELGALRPIALAPPDGRRRARLPGRAPRGLADFTALRLRI